MIQYDPIFIGLMKNEAANRRLCSNAVMQFIDDTKVDGRIDILEFVEMM